MTFPRKQTTRMGDILCLDHESMNTQKFETDFISNGSLKGMEVLENRLYGKFKSELFMNCQQELAVAN